MYDCDVDEAGRAGRTPSVEVAEALLAAGGELLAREGLSGLTTRALTATSGVARNGVYTRFGGMDGLIDALLVRAFDDLAAACDRSDLVDPCRRLWEGLIAHRRWAMANPRIYEVMFSGRPAHRSPALSEAARALVGVVVRHVEYAVAAGIIAAESPAAVAHQIVSAAHGATHLELTGRLLTEDAEAAYLDMMRTLSRGLAPSSTAGEPVERLEVG